MKEAASLPDPLVLDLTRGLLAEGRNVTLKTAGQSMRPTLRDGDTVEITPACPDSLKPGDIIAVETPDDHPFAFIVHRYIDATPDGKLITHGDGNRQPDPPSPPESLIGKVIARHRGKSTTPLDTSTQRFIGRHIKHLRPVFRLTTTLLSTALRIYRGGPPLPVGPPTQQLHDRLVIDLALGLDPNEHCANRLPDILDDARYADLLPLIAHRKHTGDISLADSSTEELKAIENTAIFRSAQAEALLRDIAAILEANRLTMLLTKGAALAFDGVYPEPHTRLGSDIDFLCHPAEKERVINALLDAGFKNAEPEYPIDYYLRYRGEVALYQPGSHAPPIEVHWTGAGRLYHHRRMGYADYQPHARPSVFGPALRVLSPEYHTLLIIQHLGKHLRHLRPLWLLDLALLTSTPDFNWATLARATHHARLHWPALHVIHWAEARRPGTFPPSFINTIKRHRPRPPRNFIDQRLSYSTAESSVRWLDALGLPTWRQRLSYWLEHIVPSRYVIERMYPDSKGRNLLPFHLRRWSRLIRQRLPQIFWGRSAK